MRPAQSENFLPVEQAVQPEELSTNLFNCQVSTDFNYYDLSKLKSDNDYSTVVTGTNNQRIYLNFCQNNHRTIDPNNQQAMASLSQETGNDIAISQAYSST